MALSHSVRLRGRGYECKEDVQQLGWQMHNSSAMKNTFLVLFGLMLMANSGLYAAPAKLTPVEVWTGGDDGLTQRLRLEIENKFRSSSDFVLSSGKKAGTLIVTIPTHVGWTTKGTRTYVRYEVKFSTSDDKQLGKSRGSCWEDNFAECVAQIYDSAQRAAHKLR